MSDVTRSDRPEALPATIPATTTATSSATPFDMTADLALPTPVRRAVLMMCVGAALSALDALVALTLRSHIRAGIEENGRTYPRDRLTAVEMDQAATTMVIVLVVSSVVATIIWLAMAWLNRRGRWWARIAATVLTLFCVLQTWSVLTRGYPTVPSAVLSLLVLVVGIAAAALLWHPDNTRHFASPRPR